MNKANRSIRLLVLLVMGPLLMLGCSAPAETEEEGEGASEALADRVALTADALESLQLSYARAEVLELAPSLELPAEVVAVPDRVAEIGARVSGRVVDVSVNTGDAVVRSSGLLTIESAEVGRAWADLVSARARERAASRALDRQRALLDGRVTSVRSFEEAQSTWEVAVADVRASLTRLAAAGIVDPGEPPGNPAQVTLYSPIAGTVTARSVNVGEWVEPSDVLLRVIDLGEVWLEAAVYEQQLQYVDIGQRVQVEMRAFPDIVFTGAVDRVSGVLDETSRSAGVRVVLSNADGRLRPGMFATARIQGTLPEASRGLVVIPRAAVQEINGNPTVFLRGNEGTFEVRRVLTGRRVGDLIEIVTGLEEGDEIVADGSFLLKGQLLRASLAEEEEG